MRVQGMRQGQFGQIRFVPAAGDQSPIFWRQHGSIGVVRPLTAISRGRASNGVVCFD